MVRVLLLLWLAPALADTCLGTVDCGFSGISQRDCEAKACCFSNATKIWCSMPLCNSTTQCSGHGVCQDQVCKCNPGWGGGFCAQTTITTVHVVQACHLDVGFADTAPNIINRYFDKHFPTALQVAAELKNDPTTNASLQFMFHSYVLSLYFSCPPGMGLHCPNEASVDAMKQAIKQGVVWYHAFPFNSELDLYDPVLIDEGIIVSHDMDDMFGLPHKQTLSQRDVPGMTRSVIPLLRNRNVTAISVGVNGASTPPQVPKIFLWKDPDTDIIAMWHPYGYGGIELSDAVMVPGLSHALVFDWNGDNAGPDTADNYRKHWLKIQQSFPDAQVVSSTFDNFTQHLAAVRSTLPVVTKEIADTWIYGVPSDPSRAAKVNVMNRVWAKFVAGQGDRTTAVYKNATRLVMKAGEHTWGLDVKSTLKDNDSWSNKAFNTARTSGPDRAQYQALQDSWWRQRAWSYGFAYEALQDAKHPMAADIANELQALAPKIPAPTLDGFSPADPTKSYTVGTYTLAFDSATGALNKFQHGSVVWATPQNMFGSVLYRTYDLADITNFLNSYLIKDGGQIPDWAFHDFGKPGCTTDCVHASYTGSLRTLWTKPITEGQAFLAQLVLAPAGGIDPHVLAGAPDAVWVRYDVPDNEETAPDGINITITVANKTVTRLPEAMFFVINPLSTIPPAPAPEAPASSWSLSKLGEWVSADQVVNGGSRHMHAASAIKIKQGGPANLVVESFDAPVFSLGKHDAYPIPTNSTPDTNTYGASSVLWDNLWGTNYIMWWPFDLNFAPVPEEANMQYRYRFVSSAHH